MSVNYTSGYRNDADNLLPSYRISD